MKEITLSAHSAVRKTQIVTMIHSILEQPLSRGMSYLVWNILLLIDVIALWRDDKVDGRGRRPRPREELPPALARALLQHAAPLQRALQAALFVR